MDWKTRIPALILWLALVLSSLGDGDAEQRIVCYYTNWSVYRPGTAKFSPQNINPYLCTHLIYAFGGFTKENTLKPFDKYQDIEKGGYAKFTGLKTYNKNLKTMLAIGGWNEGSSRFSPMVADPKRRKEFVKNSVKFLRQNHFDGLDLDWEYPAFRDGGKPRDRQNYADLVQELREEYERESSKTGRPRLLLSMAVPAGIGYIDKGYDVPRLNDYLDFINLLSYDYHSAFEPAVNHHAPLYPLEEDNEYNYDSELTIDYTIEHLLKSGASSEKIVLGIPTYGRSYTLFNEDATEIGAPADGPGEEGDATREKGYLAYYEICDSVAKSDEWEVVQPNPTAMGPYAYRENQWVGYDDEDIVRAKAHYVNEKKLGGVMFWSIDNDDFRGKCHGRPYPLIEAAKEALLAGDERSSSGQKTKPSDSQKKTRIQGSGQRIQGNTIGRKLSAGNRRTTTQGSASRRRITSSRFNARSNGRGGGGSSAEEDEEEDEDEEEVNNVKTVEKTRPRSRSKPRSKNRQSAGGRRKQQQNSRRGDDEKEESPSNKFTTPEPPTTPDPGSDFKCEDEGFFPHPRDCKKYFWCLDSGPSGLGIVGHQFTCPSGLVFNKAADSCDYPRNVVCPKTKTSESTVTTTRAPITAATSRTTYLYKPTRTTTSKPESDEEYEYYDDEEVADSEEVEEEPRTTTSAKPLLYKTISRSRPTTTTSAPVTTTTENPIPASTRTYKATTERVTSFEDEEDPRVIKELIDLIKKAGGIEQLEKQLNYQEKNSGGNSGTTEESGGSTPATISRSLYERVLNRQATRIAGGFPGSLSTTQSSNGDKSDRVGTKNSRIGFVNGPGGAQFEGLDDVPEVKSLRRTNKPQYVTIERHRSPTSESPAEDDEEIDDEVDDDNRDVASSEDQAVSNPPYQRTPNRRVTPSYVNIRRPRPSTTTNENDVEIKDEDSNPDDAEEEGETVAHRHRVVKTEEESSSPKSRYTNTQRFRSTTSRNIDEDQAEDVTMKSDFTTESTTTSTTTTTTTTTTEKVVPVTEEIEETPSSTTARSSTTSESLSSSTLEHISSAVESMTSSIPESTSDSSLKLVENSATEILFTTVAASSSSTGSRPEPSTRGPSIAVVSQPRPFGFPRRGRPTVSTSSVAPVTEQTRTKVVSETLRLPTLKELVGYTPAQTESIDEFTSTITQSSTPVVDKKIDSNALQDELIDRTVPRIQPEILIQGLVDHDENRPDNSHSRELERGGDREIFDNDILGSEEIQRSSSSSSFVEGTQYPRSTRDKEIIDPKPSIRRVEVPVKILDDANGEEIAELVILRLPESKLNSAILKPVFRVKVLEQDDKGRKDFPRDGIESVSNSNEISSENELSDDRGISSRRRRVRINSSPSSVTFADTAEESEDRVTSASRPRNRQRIVKARRRTRVQEVTSDESGERVSNRRGNERVRGGKENSKRPERFDVTLPPDTNGATVYSTEWTTTVRATTLRGNLSTPLKASNIIRGFYVTKSSIETSSSPDVITTDSSTDTTGYPSATTGNYVFDETSEKTHFATHETATPLAEGISYIADESSTYESTGTTLMEPESAIAVSNDLHSSGDVVQLMEEKLETSTPGLISTTDARFTESSALATTMTEDETSEQPEVTPFRPWTTSEVQTADPTSLMEGTTTEYFTDIGSEAIVTKSDLTTDRLSESFEASESSRYGDSPNSEVERAAVSTTAESDDNDVRTTSQTERSVRRTTTLDAKTITYKGALHRGRVRFTNVSKSDASKLSSREHPRKPAKTSEGELDAKSGTSTEAEKTVERGLVETTGSPHASSLRSRDHRRRTTTTLKIDDSTVNTVNGKELSDSTTEPYDKTAEYNFRTNFVETTGSLHTPRPSSRSNEHPRRTTESFETDRPAATATPTETYDKTVQYTSAAPEAKELGTNFVEITGSASYTGHGRKTTKSLEDSDDFAVDSTTGKYLTTTSTEIRDKTMEYATTTTEADYLSTNFVETTGSHLYTRPFPEETGTVAKTIEPYDNTTESLGTANTVPIGDSREEEDQTESMKSIGTTLRLTETTRPWSYVQRTRITDSTEDYKTESTNISNDVTSDITSDTIPPRMEAHLRTDRAETSTASETEDAETKINDQYGISTEAVQQTTETMTSPETEATKQVFSATTPASTIYDKSEGTSTIIPAETTIENIVESTTEKSLSSYPGVINEKITTLRNSERKAYSAIDSSTNTIAPVTPHDEMQRARGRVRFTNFAANADETGRNRRPVKQVVVRRRLVTESNNRHRTVDATSERNSENEAPKTSRNPNTQLAKEKQNSVELHERLAEQKEHSTNLNEQLTEEKKNTTNLNVQLAEEKKNGTKPMRRRVVVYRGRPRAGIVTTTTTMQSLSVSSDEISDDSSSRRRRRWRKRLVLKRPRTEEDDQSIAETVHFRRAIIDDSLADFRDLGSSIEDYEVANSAERADEDNGGEVNLYKSSEALLRRPGSPVRGQGTNRSKIKTQGNSDAITLPVGQTSVFSKIHPVAEDVRIDDQSGRAQELAVTLAEPLAVGSSSTTGRLPFRTTSTTRKISTTIAPRTEAPTISRTTPLVRRRQRPRGNSNNERIVENVTTRPRRPAIIDYDYYVDDDDVRLVVKPELKDKLYVTRKGGIRCLDQGNFAHPTSCKKFITCARMVNGQVIGTEYTCPDKLSFDPVGGICNWSAGLGCEDKKG